MVAGDREARLASALEQLDKAIDGLHHAAEHKDAAQADQNLNLAATGRGPISCRDPAMKGR